MKGSLLSANSFYFIDHKLSKSAAGLKGLDVALSKGSSSEKTVTKMSGQLNPIGVFVVFCIQLDGTFCQELKKEIHFTLECWSHIYCTSLLNSRVLAKLSPN